MHSQTASRTGAYLAWAFLFAATVYGAALGGHLADWRAAIEERAERVLIAGGFGIEEVVIKGRDRLSRAQVEDALASSRARTIFGFDTRAAKARLEAVGWVKSAQVMRLWPSTLVVELKERVPFARWRIRGHTLLIDREGELLGPVTPAFAHLPRVAGEGADRAAAQLFGTLEGFASIAERLQVAKRVERRRWDLVLADGRIIQLPAEGVPAALSLAARLPARGLPAGANVVDLRVAGRIALRRKAPEPEREKLPDRLSATAEPAGVRPL